MNPGNEKGSSTVELALILPIIMTLILVVVEGASAMHTYSSVLEASREGARMYVIQGGSVDVPDMVQGLTDHLAITPSTTVTHDAQGKTVTVEVNYAYQSFFGNSDILESFGTAPFNFSASTTMPLP